MIANKNQLIKALKEKRNLSFTTIRNNEKDGYMVGVKRKPGTIVQTNAFTIATQKNGEFINSWIYLNEIEVKNGIIKYKKFDIEIAVMEESA